MKILFITDSLGFCRNTPEKVAYNETYINLTQKKNLDYEIVHLGIGGGTISDLLEQSNYYTSFDPGLIFIQSGIVDCAPRAYTKFEIEFIKKIPFVSGFLQKIMRKYSSKIRNIRKRSYSNPEEYLQKTKKIKSIFRTDNIYSIGIMPASAEYEKKLKRIISQIEKYNCILNHEFNDKFIDSLDFREEDMMSDFHHLSKKGHFKLFNKINKVISELKN